jgi:choline kinase
MRICSVTYVVVCKHHALVDLVDAAVSTKGTEPRDEAKPEIQLDQDTDLYKAQEDEEFDYLAYAQDRAMFVWGDLVGMGLVKKEELPETLRNRMKIVEY